MKKILPRNFIFALLLGLMFTSTVLADTASAVTKQQADSAVSVLNITKRLRHCCPPCKNSVVRDEQISSVIASKKNDP
ncbi:MAG: hypothetical protein ACR2F2_13750, partial [Pyrinomonadaceae bacterium]